MLISADAPLLLIDLNPVFFDEIPLSPSYIIISHDFRICSTHVPLIIRILSYGGWSQNHQLIGDVGGKHPNLLDIIHIVSTILLVMLLKSYIWLVSTILLVISTIPSITMNSSIHSMVSHFFQSTLASRSMLSQVATPSWPCLQLPRPTPWSSGRTATDPTGRSRVCGDIREEHLSLGEQTSSISFYIYIYICISIVVRKKQSILSKHFCSEASPTIYIIIEQHYILLF